MASMDAVIVLGAGASAGFGVPTLRHLFKDRHAREHIARDEFLRDSLYELIWNPRGVTLDTSHESLTIEEILTLLRDSEIRRYDLPTLLAPDDIKRFRRSLYVLIKKAVHDGKSGLTKCFHPLISFARAHFNHTTWASFNWDVFFEDAYYNSSAPPGALRVAPSLVIDVRGWPDAGKWRRHTLLKLHGAINWWYEDGMISSLRHGASPRLADKWRAYEAGESDGHPVILEPSYYKYSSDMHRLLKPQWSHFVGALSRADVVIVAGYSLPDADSEARSAMTLGFQANKRARWLILDPSPEVCARYERYLGSTRLITAQCTLRYAGDNPDRTLARVLP
jgi:SIR2-like domain